MLDNPIDPNSELSTAPKILRPTMMFSGPEGELSPTSWFERNKLYILKAMQMTDLSFSRMVAAGMLFEAWNSAAFYCKFESGESPTEFDRMCLIAWLQHYSSIFGILSYDEICLIRDTAKNYERIIGDKQSEEHLPEAFKRRIYRDHSEASDLLSILDTIQRQKEEGKVIGIFHGSLDPPHVGHTASLNYFHQYCDYLLCAIDSDPYIKNVKVQRRDPSRRPYNEHERLSIMRHFPHLHDQLMVLPFQDLEDLQNRIVDFYKELGVDIVFFSRVDSDNELFERRCIQVIDAGATPFAEHPFANLRFTSSTKLMDAVKNGTAIDPNLPF